jgi:hypothetical protein
LYPDDGTVASADVDHDAIVHLAAMLRPFWETSGGAEGLGCLKHAVAAGSSAPLLAQAEVRVGLAMALVTEAPST